MFSGYKKVLSAGLMLAGLFLAPVCSWADEDYHPTNDGGNFGIGLEVGQPGDWGATGKIWIDRENAFQPAVKFDSGGTAILQLDYLWHNFDIIQIQNGELPLYIGLGGDLVLENSVEFAARVPVGISYIFDKRNVPIDIYLQAVPTIWFPDGGQALFDVYGELGAHFYL
jgi:hypothetical protein